MNQNLAVSLCSLFLSAAVVGCVTTPRVIDMQESTTQLVGWISVNGEWTLFPESNFRNYRPFGKNDEREKCVSLINDTGSTREQFQGLEGKKVTVTGFVVKYVELADGSSAGDRLLSKKYYKSDPVENYCLRNLVFVVKDVRKSD